MTCIVMCYTLVGEIHVQIVIFASPLFWKPFQELANNWGPRFLSSSYYTPAPIQFYALMNRLALLFMGEWGPPELPLASKCLRICDLCKELAFDVHRASW